MKNYARGLAPQYLNVGVVVGRGRLVEVWRQHLAGERGRVASAVAEDVVGRAEHGMSSSGAGRSEVVGGVTVGTGRV